MPRNWYRIDGKRPAPILRHQVLADLRAHQWTTALEIAERLRGVSFVAVIIQIRYLREKHGFRIDQQWSYQKGRLEFFIRERKGNGAPASGLYKYRVSRPPEA
jgi:hypothetical protein